jgi:uncharacterized membrane-anchored protein
MQPSNVPAWRRQPMAAKVPEISAVFWLIKVLTTGMGEASADYLSTLSLVLAGGVGVVGIVVALWWQFRTPRYTAVAYWFAVVMVAVFGTMVADGPRVVLGISYLASTIICAAVLAGILVAWWRSEGTLSIHSIVTRRRETFYWLTVLATFALGTATGDLVADTLHLGFFWAGAFFAVLMVVPALGWWRFGLSPVVAFWTAYVLTRPLGASFADWLGKPHSFAGGLGLGDGPVSAVALVLIVVLVGYVAVSGRDVQRPLADPVVPDALRPAAEGA